MGLCLWNKLSWYVIPRHLESGKELGAVPENMARSLKTCQHSTPQFGFELEITLLKSIFLWLHTCQHTLTIALQPTSWAGISEDTLHLLICNMLMDPNVCFPLNLSWVYLGRVCLATEVWSHKRHSLQLILNSDHISPWTNYYSHKSIQLQLWIVNTEPDPIFISLPSTSILYARFYMDRIAMHFLIIGMKDYFYCDHLRCVRVSFLLILADLKRMCPS